MKSPERISQEEHQALQDKYTELKAQKMEGLEGVLQALLSAGPLSSTHLHWLATVNVRPACQDRRTHLSCRNLALTYAHSIHRERLPQLCIQLAVNCVSPLGLVPAQTAPTVGPLRVRGADGTPERRRPPCVSRTRRRASRSTARQRLLRRSTGRPRCGGRRPPLPPHRRPAHRCAP